VLLVVCDAAYIRDQQEVYLRMFRFWRRHFAIAFGVGSGIVMMFVATVGCSDLSRNWAEQLAGGAVLLVLMEHAGGHPLCLLHKEPGGLRARVASWTAFMPIRGPLHVDGLWPIGMLQPDSPEPVHQRDPWPGFGATGSLPWLGCSADEIDLLFYLSLLDRRACWARDGLNGWALAGPDGIRWWQDASLVEQLDRLHSRWLACGRPTVRDYQVAFVPIGEDAVPPPGGCAVERRFFRELIWLQRPDLVAGRSVGIDHGACSTTT
jgi:Cytochrome bd terminal oxidase subunit I